MTFPSGVWILFAFAISIICTTNNAMAGKITLNISKQDMTSTQCEQEGYYGNENNCSSFYRCVEDASQFSEDGQKVFKRVDFECPPGTIFVEEIKACNYPDRMNPKPGCMQFTQDEDEIGTGYAGLPGMKCDNKGFCPGGVGCNFTDPNNIFLVPCDLDCRNSHNAEYGICTKRDFCTCGPASKSVKPKSIQCLDIKHAELFQSFCMDDCQCIHNAVGGGCNFYTKACECGETVDKNGTNKCRYKTSNELFLDHIAKYESINIDIMKVITGQEQTSE